MKRVGKLKAMAASGAVLGALGWLTALAAPSTPAPAPPIPDPPAVSRDDQWSAKVVAIHDGDTISVLHDRAEEKLRLHGIDSPEAGQPHGKAAKQAASALAFGKVVRVVPRDKDKYGRTVAVVYLPDGSNLNSELVRRGHAWWYKEYAPRETGLGALQEQARQSRRGLWASASRVPPWEWRNNPAVRQPAKPKRAPPQPTVARRAPTAPSRSYGSTSTSYAPAPVYYSPPPAAASGTVYVTNTGSKYHSAGCRYLRQSSNPMSESAARAQGHSACSVCGG